MRIFSRILPLLFLLLLVGCQRFGTSKLDLKGSDLTGTSLGGDFTLTAHDGKSRSLADYRGKVVALFFGYTHCPDVCPTTLLEYAAVAKKLGKDADKLQVIFVSVDPERDTPAIMASYVPHFNPAFVGMTGSKQQVGKVMKMYQVVAQKIPTADGNYSIDHSAGSYLLDQDGRVRVYEPYGSSIAAITHDIQQLLR
jgi:protein SCO1/2